MCDRGLLLGNADVKRYVCTTLVKPCNEVMSKV